MVGFIQLSVRRFGCSQNTLESLLNPGKKLNSTRSLLSVLASATEEHLKNIAHCPPGLLELLKVCPLLSMHARSESWARSFHQNSQHCQTKHVYRFSHKPASTHSAAQPFCTAFAGKISTVWSRPLEQLYCHLQSGLRCFPTLALPSYAPTTSLLCHHY